MSSKMTKTGANSEQRGALVGLRARYLPMVFLYSAVVIAAILINSLVSSVDYVGPDNDDAMRLVEVRDFLSGQGWFDLMQYRLGLLPGTLMHWSRLIDLPIAALIRFFSLFGGSREHAEALALTAWPSILCLLFLAALGLGARRGGGITAMHLALGLGGLFAFTTIRFYPGAADHHNAQVVLMMTIAAMLVDRRRNHLSHAIAGLAVACAMAIGAETVPIVAAACVCVALQWAWYGETFGRPARAFGLSLAISISVAFFATVPPQAYGVVTCDNLSFGFYSLTAIGGAGLFLIATLFRKAEMKTRFVALLGLALVVALSAGLIAPQCLGNPLGTLDPMLVELWLDNVMEAQSIFSVIRHDPATAGGFYAVGLFGLSICVFRILTRQRVEFHAVMLALIAAAWGVNLIQVRGALFANALSILPLALIIDDLRRRSNADPENISAGFAYVITVLASVPVMWAVVGVLWTKGIGAMTASDVTSAGTALTQKNECGGRDDMRALALLPTGTVAAPSDNGAGILRFTGHRVLSAPYHRNQGGMLTELHIGLSTPKDAEAFLRGAGVTILAFCKQEGQTKQLARLKPDGLYAALARNEVPPYLLALPRVTTEGFRFFEVLPPKR